MTVVVALLFSRGGAERSGSRLNPWVADSRRFSRAAGRPGSVQEARLPTISSVPAAACTARKQGFWD